MALKYKAGNQIEGLSSDTKPTSVPNPSYFWETDTFSYYEWNGTSWLKEEDQAETFTNKTISGSSNTITNIGDSAISSHTSTKITITAKGQLNSAIVYNDQANTYGDFNQIFRSSRLIVTNPANTFNYTFIGAAIAAARNITLPLLTGNDTMVTEAFAQTLTNKTIAAGSNTVTGIVDANISTHTTTKISTTSKSLLNTAIVYNDQTNTFGAFDQILPNSRLKIQNPAATFNYIIATSAIAADRTVTLPLLTGNDTLTLNAFAATLTNKTIETDNNTIKHSTTNTAGDILKNSGTKFDRLARGTALQVLQVNSGATDVAWASLQSERTGKSTASGNGTTTVFNIAHGLGSTPSYAFVDCSSHAITRTFTLDSTNISVTFSSAPSSGTNNVIIYWRVIA